MVQKSGKLTSWGNGSSFPLFPKVLYMHPTGGFLAEFLNPSTVNEPKSWKQKKKSNAHKGFPPTRPGDPPNFPPVFPVNLSPPPGQNKPPGGLAQISIKPCYLGGHLLSASPNGSYMTEKNLRNAFNWWLFFFVKKIMCFLYIQEHMFRKLWKCIEILIWQSVYKEKIYSLTRKRPIRDF